MGIPRTKFGSQTVALIGEGKQGMKTVLAEMAVVRHVLLLPMSPGPRSSPGQRSLAAFFSYEAEHPLIDIRLFLKPSGLGHCPVSTPDYFVEAHLGICVDEGLLVDVRNIL